MSVVSWGAPTFKLSKLGASPAVTVTIPGDILLENSSQLQTQEGDTKTLKNEKGEDVDRKKMPASYTATTSVIKKKADTVWENIKTALNPVNGVVAGEWEVICEAEDPQTVGFKFPKATISTSKGWDSQQGALEILSFNGLVPDGGGEICEDYSAS